MESTTLLYGVGLLFAAGLIVVSIGRCALYDDNPFILVLRAVGRLRMRAATQTTILGQGASLLF